MTKARRCAGWRRICATSSSGAGWRGRRGVLNGSWRLRGEQAPTPRCDVGEALGDACAPGVFEYEYDAAGDLVAVREANGLRRYYHYDARRRLAVVELEGERQSEITTRYRYDEQDRLESVESRGCVTAYRYDERGASPTSGMGKTRSASIAMTRRGAWCWHAHHR